jgi:hypothetical protein
MNDQQFCGKWVGEYTYGEEYEDPVKGKTVAFELDITIVNGLLKGECTDAEATAHFEQPTTIEGTVLDNTITFVKRYPHYWQHEKNGQRFLPKLPSQEICYSGQFVNDRFEGEWEIVTKLADAHGDLVAFRGLGRWFMKRKV